MFLGLQVNSLVYFRTAKFPLSYANFQSLIFVCLCMCVCLSQRVSFHFIYLYLSVRPSIYPYIYTCLYLYSVCICMCVCVFFPRLVYISRQIWRDFFFFHKIPASLVTIMVSEVELTWFSKENHRICIQ